MATENNETPKKVLVDLDGLQTFYNGLKNVFCKQKDLEDLDNKYALKNGNSL